MSFLITLRLSMKKTESKDATKNKSVVSMEYLTGRMCFPYPKVEIVTER